MLRDLTPEDYETLLKLDDSVAKKTAGNIISKISAVDLSPAESSSTCGICLLAFSDSPLAPPPSPPPPCVIKRLSCGHVFHAECIDRWLQNYADRCPIDNKPLTL